MSPEFRREDPNINLGNINLGIMCAFCIFLCDSSQLGVLFCIHLVFLKDEITHKQTQICILPKLFPNTSITLEHISK